MNEWMNQCFFLIIHDKAPAKQTEPQNFLCKNISPKVFHPEEHFVYPFSQWRCCILDVYIRIRTDSGNLAIFNLYVTCWNPEQDWQVFSKGENFQSKQTPLRF